MTWTTRPTRHHLGAARPSRFTRLVPVFCALAGLVGCQQKMACQPSYRPFQPSVHFADGMSARHPPEGTIAREWLRADDPVMSGLKEAGRGSPAPAGEKEISRPRADAPSDPGKFMDGFPFDLTRADLDRGQERYTIFCAVCHDPVGTGKGKIPERGYVKPPNYHTDPSRGFGLYGRTIALRNVPVGYLFEVVSRGYGAMPRYAAQIPAKDRWRIVAYIRALQLSQYADLSQLPAPARQSTLSTLGGPQ